MLTDLNVNQKEVATFNKGIALVVAVAGSGKTKTMIERALWLIAQGTTPQSIWMTTFTNKAAKEIKTRLSRQNQEGSKVQVGTFHSFCLKIAKQNQLINDKTIIDQDDIEQALKLILEMDDAGNYGNICMSKPRTLYEIFSYKVNTCSTLEAAVNKKAPSLIEFLAELKKLEKEYTNFKIAQNLLDFDDIIVKAIEYLDTPSGVSVKNSCGYLIVDEFQDTNKLQFELILKLTAIHKNLMCVGDDAQSIYSFRGANPKQLEDFLRAFPSLKIFKLEKNYRSKQGILDVGNYALSLMDSTIKKQLISANKFEDKSGVSYLEVADEPTQMDKILQVIKKSDNYADICVLVKYGYQSALLEVKLLANKIPYIKYGGLKFLEKRHIKDVISFLKVKLNPKDQLAVYRCLTMIPGIGPKSAQSIFTNIERGDSWENSLTKVKQKSNLIYKILLEFDSAQNDLESLLTKVITAYTPILEKNADSVEKLMSHKTDLLELKKIALEYSSITNFISDVILGESAIESTSAENCVLISTIHSIKGLEREHVIIPNVYEGVYPRFTASSEDAEEEKRLFYVAVTRAKNNLTLLKPYMLFKGDRTIDSGFLSTDTKKKKERILY